VSGPARPSAKRRRLPAAALSVAGHGAVIAALFLWQPQPPKEPPPEPIVVALIPPPRIEPPPPPPEEPKPEEAPAPKSEAPPAPEKPPPPKRIRVRPAKAPPPPDIDALLARAAPVESNGESDVSDAELASAAKAGSGGGGTGGGCDMAGRVQQALRKSPLIQSSVASANRGKAIRVWNGRWVRHGVEDGAGLAAVREAILWEVGFAPEACRSERVRGLVALSLNDGPGAARLVVGAGEWRWKDLLRRNGPTG
jgi:hypothetical protein